MNLSELATFICNKVRHPDSNSIAICKQFINRRYQMIYDGDLWRDSLFVTTPTITPNDDPQSAAGIYQLPDLVEKVVAVKTDVNAMTAYNQEQFFRMDLDVYAQTGVPAVYTLLPPIVWDFGEISADFYTLDNAGIIAPTPTAGALVAAVYSNVADINTLLTVRYQDNDGTIQETTLAASQSQFQPITTYSAAVSKIISVTKPVTVAQVSLATVLAGGGTIVYSPLGLSANATASSKMARLKLTYIPTINTNLQILFKLKWKELADGETPILNGLENVLCAYAQGDMLERERQYGKAQLCYQEGAGLLEAYRRREVYQQSNNPRFLPVDDYPPLGGYGVGGGSNFGFPGKGWW